MPTFDAWDYDNGQRVSRAPVAVGCLQARVAAWGDIEPQCGQAFSEKQSDAWHRFDALDPDLLRADLAVGLESLAQRVCVAPSRFGSVIGTSERAQELAALFDRAADQLRAGRAERRRWPQSLRPTGVVVPQQDQSERRLIVLSLDLGPSDDAFAVEALFANEKIALLGEHCGLPARREWAEINSSGADLFAVEHPYW